MTEEILELLMHRNAVITEEALKKYYVENKYGVASAGDLIGAFERVGVDATGFFEGFLNGKEIL